MNRRTGAAFDTYVGRPSPWGNPFKVGRDGSQAEVVAKFREWVRTSMEPRAVWIRRNVHKLRGKRLACWCAPAVCHADVLAEMAEASSMESAA